MPRGCSPNTSSVLTGPANEETATSVHPFVAALACLLALTFGCGRPRPPNLLIVVVDTLRADRLGSAGNPDGLTPFLDDLAKTGVRFDNAFAASSWTVPSVASLFTSRFPTQHRVTSYESVLADDEVTLVEQLQGQGFVSAGFTANPRLTASFGYAQGFDAWQVVGKAGKARGPEVRAACLGWLDGTRSSRPDAPIALYVHLMEPHAPYNPPAGIRSRVAPGASAHAIRTANRKLIPPPLFGDTVTDRELALLQQLYDGEVAAADDELRALFGALTERGFLERAVVVVTADHGEEFREHDVIGHGYTLYDSGLRVPLLLSWPGGPRDEVVDEPVSLVDLAPTLLSAVGGAAAARFEGRSLLPLVRGEDEAHPVLAELVPVSETDEMFRRHRAAWMEGRWTLLLDRRDRGELFDRGAEGSPAPGAPEPELRRRLAERRTDIGTRANPSSRTTPLGDDEARRLRELGYVID